MVSPGFIVTKKNYFTFKFDDVQIFSLIRNEIAKPTIVYKIINHIFFFTFAGRITKSSNNDSDDNNSLNNPRDQYVTKRTKTKVSSICLNLPAAGLGQRPPSVVSSLTDEGGFNEPSPEIKAKLKPAYTFENLPPLTPTHNNAYENPEYVDVQEVKTEIITQVVGGGGHDLVSSDTLNYIDVGYRIRPEGTDAPAVYGEDELYRSSIKNSVLEELEHEEQMKIHVRSQANAAFVQQQHRTNGVTNVTTTVVTSAEKVVYATIKPEPPPPIELILDAEKDEAKFLDFEEKTETEKGYHSPQTILDPTRPTLAEREDDDLDGEEDDDFDDDDVRMICNKPLPPEPPISRPPTIPEDSTLDLHDVEYADASDNETSMPDAMTADEAERLLSSR
jgi:neurabin